MVPQTSLSPQKNIFDRSGREEYIKIFLTSSEMKVFQLQENTVVSFFKQNGYAYNRPEHFRLLLLNSNNPELLALLLKLYLNDDRSAFKLTDKKVSL